MLEDAGLELTSNVGTGQAITATGIAGRPLDLGAAGTDPALGEPLQALVQFTQDYNNLTSIQLDIMNDDDGAGTNAASVATITVLLANATVAKGTQRLGGIIAPGAIKRRWLDAKATVTGTTPTQGKVRVWLEKGRNAVPANKGAL